jgi:hypothetical protein
MARSSVMVYTGSTVCIQALAMELPVVHLRPRFSLDLDPFEGEDEARFDALNPAELRERVGAVLQDRQSHIDQRRKLWMDLVKDMHGPVTEETYLAFVGP